MKMEQWIYENVSSYNVTVPAGYKLEAWGVQIRPLYIHQDKYSVDGTSLQYHILENPDWRIEAGFPPYKQWLSPLKEHADTLYTITVNGIDYILGRGILLQEGLSESSLTIDFPQVLPKETLFEFKFIQ